MSRTAANSSEITRVGIIGCGSMGSELAMVAAKGDAGPAEVVALFDVFEPGRQKLATSIKEMSGSEPAQFDDVDEMIANTECDLIVECASQQAVFATAEQVLSSGVSMLIMSSGALLNADFMSKVEAATKTSGASLYVPSGAVGGIDALRAAKHLLEEVTITSSKKPVSLAGAPGFSDWEDQEITEPTVVFDGNAAEAVGLFPANVNVAATVSLAGVGAEKTRVKVVADPDSLGNVHEISAKSKAGNFSFKFENMPYEHNPKTSYLAALAAIETLRSICNGGLRIGT